MRSTRVFADRLTQDGHSKVDVVLRDTHRRLDAERLFNNHRIHSKTPMLYISAIAVDITADGFETDDLIHSSRLAYGELAYGKGNDMQF